MPAAAPPRLPPIHRISGGTYSAGDRGSGVTAQLLRQTGRFEGLLTGAVFAAPRDLSIADCEYASDDLICFDTAEPGASPESLSGDHLVSTSVDHLHQL